jgi:hypothetical protein
MPSPPHRPDTRNVNTPRPAPHPEEVTATDLVGSPPEYLKEMHSALQRAEQAYAIGDLAAAARAAEEGLAAIRLVQTKLGPQGVAPQYAAFFHCFRVQPEFRKALGLFKRGLTGRQAACRTPKGKSRPQVGDHLFRTAWVILQPGTAGVMDDLPVELLVYEHPVAGRVLRSVLRLRAKLLACLDGSPEDTIDI